MMELRGRLGEKGKSATRSWNLFWLFKKRFTFEFRKYSSAIILTMGVTALFIALLVVGSSFISASQRASGENGPLIMDVETSQERVYINSAMPDKIQVDCTITTNLPLDRVLLVYSDDLWNTRNFLNGTLETFDLQGFHYRFFIDLVPRPRVYLFYIWANNSGGFFSFDDNNGNFYSIRVSYEEDLEPEPIDPNNLTIPGPVISIKFGTDNRTTTSDPRPPIVVQVNETSSAWLQINGFEYTFMNDTDYFIFELMEDLKVGENEIDLFIQQGSEVYTRHYTLNYTNAPPILVSLNPANGSVLTNFIYKLEAVFDEEVIGTFNVTGPSNYLLTTSIYNSTIKVPTTRLYKEGNYSITIQVEDKFGYNETIHSWFYLNKTLVPAIRLSTSFDSTPFYWSHFNVSFEASKLSNFTVTSLNMTGWNATANETTRIILWDVPLVNGTNVFNVSVASVDGQSNSKLFTFEVDDLKINEILAPRVTVPGSKFHVKVNFTSYFNVSMVLWYRAVGSSTWKLEPFTLESGTLSNGKMRAIAVAPSERGHIEYFINVTLGSAHEVIDGNGSFFIMLVDNFYEDFSPPIFKRIINSPSRNPYSHEEVEILVELDDLSGISKAFVYFNEEGKNSISRTMTYLGQHPLGIGSWHVYLPSFPNGTRVYYSIYAVDREGNVATWHGNYRVLDEVPEKIKIEGVYSQEYEDAINGAITTLLVIMVLIIIVFVVLFISLNDQNIKREIFREEDRIFILRHICKLSSNAIRKYYYIEQLVQDTIGFILGLLLGFLFLAPVFVEILKQTLIAWTYDFNTLFFMSFESIGSWVYLLVGLFIASTYFIKLSQVDYHVGKLVN